MWTATDFATRGLSIGIRVTAPRAGTARRLVTARSASCSSSGSGRGRASGDTGQGRTIRRASTTPAKRGMTRAGGVGTETAQGKRQGMEYAGERAWRGAVGWRYISQRRARAINAAQSPTDARKATGRPTLSGSDRAGRIQRASTLLALWSGSGSHNLFVRRAGIRDLLDLAAAAVSSGQVSRPAPQSTWFTKIIGSHGGGV